MCSVLEIQQVSLQKKKMCMSYNSRAVSTNKAAMTSAKKALM